MASACRSLLVGRDGSDGLAAQGDNTAVGTHDIADGANVKNSTGKGMPAYGIILNDLDGSGCRLVIKRGDRNGCQVHISRDRYL